MILPGEHQHQHVDSSMGCCKLRHSTTAHLASPRSPSRRQPDSLWPHPPSRGLPGLQVRHEDLEKHDGVPTGKYTVGLGQQGLAFVGDREDPVSMALTALRRLLEKHGVSPLEVRRPASRAKWPPGGGPPAVPLLLCRHRVRGLLLAGLAAACSGMPPPALAAGPRVAKLSSSSCRD